MLHDSTRLSSLSSSSTHHTTVSGCCSSVRYWCPWEHVQQQLGLCARDQTDALRVWLRLASILTMVHTQEHTDKQTDRGTRQRSKRKVNSLSTRILILPVSLCWLLPPPLPLPLRVRA
jgi:hypothetical protein